MKVRTKPLWASNSYWSGFNVYLRGGQLEDYFSTDEKRGWYAAQRAAPIEMPFTDENPYPYTDEDPYRASMEEMLDDNEDYREEVEWNRRGGWL